SPEKRSRLGSSGDDNKMDVQESVEKLEDDEDQEMDNMQDSRQAVYQSKISRGELRYQSGALGDVNLSPHVPLHDYCQSRPAVTENTVLMNTDRIKQSVKGPVAPSKSSAQTRSPLMRLDNPKIPSMDEYRRKMEDKGNTPGVCAFSIPSTHPTSEKCNIRQRVNKMQSREETSQHNKQGLKETAVIQRSSGYSCRGFMWYILHFVLLVLLGSAVLLAYKTSPWFQKIVDGVRLPKMVKQDEFADQLSLLEARFPSQQPELWRRSKIHLGKHLQTSQPTEPVSLILTAGAKAEKTLYCMAQGLASAFSSAFNASVLHIDGASKASQESDEVKLDIDSQLKSAFEGDKPVAVIHRFEELPPGSTLIFYRYCDHENAAYKRVFLLFTVLLPQDEVSDTLSLKEVEEIVQDYVKERLVSSSHQTAFNKMDSDKYSGLWSRISHLILPVVSEKAVEQKGC
ncbi:hypothetical protein L3Q82_025806, partial [Scortum barcoo]